jgi:alkaline phosphatase D
MQSLVATSAGLVVPRRSAAVITSERFRPKNGWGIGSGDVTPEGAVIWSRADRPSNMMVEWAVDAAFRTAQPVAPVECLDATDFTGKIALKGLPSGREIFYRITFESLWDGAQSSSTEGHFRTPDITGNRPVSFAWSGDTVGQGFGINPKIGGMYIHRSIMAEDPDCFVHCGDLIYADQPLRETKGAGQGRTWHNMVTPAKRKVAETLEEFRGNFRYNLLDDHVRALNAHVPWVVQWDDHETKNNWWPGRVLNEDRRYKNVKSCSLLAARGRRAFFEYTPIATRLDDPSRIYRTLAMGPLLEMFVLDARSYRTPNNTNRQKTYNGRDCAFFGMTQVRWLIRQLQASTSTWKVIVCDQPISLIISHGRYSHEGMANGKGPPMGRELELVEILKAIKASRIRNVVWITADVHYAAAHRYDPNRASWHEFDEFWEFVAGPLNAGTFGPNRIDPTFGVDQVFCSETKGAALGRSPLDKHQYYGVGRVDPDSKALTVSLHDLDGKRLWGIDLQPKA